MPIRIGNEDDVMDETKQVMKWPKSWSFDRQSEVFGEKVLAEMMPFIQSIMDHGYAKRTLERHLEYLFLMGGELISMAAIDEEYDCDVRAFFMENLDEGGGPLCRHLHTEERERQYDATCRKLFRFMEVQGE